jgi:hypothetical protein
MNRGKIHNPVHHMSSLGQWPLKGKVVYSVFNDAFELQLVWNENIVTERCVGKNVEGSGSGLVLGTIRALDRRG